MSSSYFPLFTGLTDEIRPFVDETRELAEKACTKLERLFDDESAKADLAAAAAALATAPASFSSPLAHGGETGDDEFSKCCCFLVSREDALLKTRSVL